MNQMLRNQWSHDLQLKKWNSVSCTENRGICICSNDYNHVELWEHDSCIRGRIDTKICTKCDVIIGFNIIR